LLREGGDRKEVKKTSWESPLPKRGWFKKPVPLEEKGKGKRGHLSSVFLGREG
jgi:hypothetical protein